MLNMPLRVISFACVFILYNENYTDTVCQYTPVTIFISYREISDTMDTPFQCRNITNINYHEETEISWPLNCFDTCFPPWPVFPPKRVLVCLVMSFNMLSQEWIRFNRHVNNDGLWRPRSLIFPTEMLLILNIISFEQYRFLC